VVFSVFFVGAIGKGCGGGGGVSRNSDVDKIIRAKAVVKSVVNYPDTLDFHDMSTSVSGNKVTLKFTAKNGFGVPSTYTETITVD
jgi:hypothetical protein